ncbi:hypothetical protein CBU02nite_13970 [Clostridium butyricum]|uniref:Glycosyltransferase 2-like domain-containing protein n=1 Tax=Clostridium butyricum TaxID=1492 RepID=A0A512TLG1_CLOBU|nr:glycosyltransferase [Clostridium butyricum]NOW24198.1 GT2 family glycosyltransferase [Clostridium butyricum]GEQ20891.1 hypothetical protein CBU02nite_13970 [Clostridium butyricum]
MHEVEKISFVILHYMALEETKECVESIINNIAYENYNIVIVDNNSPNGSGVNIQGYFVKNDKVKVILNKKNSGFAKGNNIGYVYAKEKLKSDFIILINNDTIIEQIDFIDVFLEFYKKESYYALGPDIVTFLDKEKHQNPVRINGIDRNELKRIIRNINIKYKIVKFIYKREYKKLFDIYLYFIEKLSKLRSNGKLDGNNVVRENVQLHGACIILSPLYIKSSSYAFYPETYMYMEEDIFYYLCKKNNFKIMYNPNLRIYHKEDVSTNMIVKSNIEKMLFILKHSKYSSKVLLDLMKEN